MSILDNLKSLVSKKVQTAEQEYSSLLNKGEALTPAEQEHILTLADTLEITLDDVDSDVKVRSRAAVLQPHIDATEQRHQQYKDIAVQIAEREPEVLKAIDALQAEMANLYADKEKANYEYGLSLKANGELDGLTQKFPRAFGNPPKVYADIKGDSGMDGRTIDINTGKVVSPRYDKDHKPSF